MPEETHMNQGPAVSPQAGAMGEQRRGQTRSDIADRGHRVEISGTQQASKKLTTSARVSGGEMLADAKERLRTFKQDTDDYVRKNPAKAIFTALGFGFVLGLMRRR